MGGTPYKQISQSELKQLPIQDIAEKDCCLFLFATLPKLPEALELMKAWGFTFTCVPFVWVKLNPNGTIIEIDKTTNKFLEIKSFIITHFQTLFKKFTILFGGVYSGLGHWTCGNAEIVLMGKIGHPKRLTKDVKQIIFAPRSRHSRKPNEVRVRIKRLMGDTVPAIELFATEKIEGWDSIGDEIDGLDIKDSLEYTMEK
jgi:N6-adenosine-specific RNA methylase IME4